MIITQAQHFVKALFSIVWFILFPKKCTGCNRWSTRYICKDCQSKLEPLDNNCFFCEKRQSLGLVHLSCLRPENPCAYQQVWKYNKTSRRIVAQLKYKFVRDAFAELFALIPKNPIKLLKELIKTLPQPVALVPVPLSRSRLKWRGFNQSEIIADFLGENLKIPVENSLLRRINYNKPQAHTSSRLERNENIKHSFRASKEILYKSIILVDDVVTTGATTRECAKIFLQGGAAQVGIFSLFKD